MSTWETAGTAIMFDHDLGIDGDALITGVVTDTPLRAVSTWATAGTYAPNKRGPCDQRTFKPHYMHTVQSPYGRKPHESYAHAKVHVLRVLQHLDALTEF